jgi:hypothetical protein
MTPTLHDAVLALYTNAVWISGNDANSLIAKDSDENLIILDKSAITSKLAELQTQESAQEQAQVTAKASALAKLAALGLTQDEVKALVG